MMERLLKPQESSSVGDLNTGGICFSCEQIFSTQQFLEEHVCPLTSHICSCGTEFALYEDMFSHNLTHEPGQQVLHHETIKKRRFEKHIEEEEQLKRFKLGEVVWNLDGGSGSAKQSPSASAFSTKITKPISYVPKTYPSMASSFNGDQTGLNMKSMFSTVGAPTVDLWTIYQPVVLVQTIRKWNQWKPYTCGKCGEGFVTKRLLISHTSSHIADKICGCIGCGLLLSSRKLMPRFHTCNSSSTTTKLRLITARPLNYKSPIQEIDLTRNPNKYYLNAGNENNQMLQVTSALQLKNVNVRTYSRLSQGGRTMTSQQFKHQNSTLNAPQKSGWKRPPSPATNSGNLSKPAATSPGAADFTCRVCHVSFESTQMLQRHKCAKAEEFLAKHGRIGKMIQPRRDVVISKATANRVNGERSRTFPSDAKNEQVTYDKGQHVDNVDMEDKEDDCYIVETGQEKTSEMIYQVTSSVPIKT